MTIFETNSIQKMKFNPTIFLTIAFVFTMIACKNIQYSKAKEEAKTPTQFGQIEAKKSDSLYILGTFFTDGKLKSIIAEAMTNNYDVMIALQHLNMAQSQVIGFRGNLFPKLDLMLSSSMRRFGKYTMDGVGNFDTQFSPNITQDQVIPEHLPDYYAGVFMSWEADIWGKLRNRKKAAVMRYLASVEGRKWLMTLILEDIALTYYDLVAKDMELEFLKQTIEIQTNELTVVKNQKAAGRTDEMVVKQFEAQLLNTRGVALILQQQIYELENRLNLLMGRYPQPIDRNKMNIQVGENNPIFSTIPIDLVSNRADIKQSELLVASTKADLKAAKAAFYPSLNINVAGGFNSFNPNFFLNPASLAYNALGGVAAPLLNRSALVAEFKYADANQLEAIYQYQQGFVKAYSEIYNQMLAIQTYKQAFELKLEEVNVLKYANDIAFELYVSGRINYLEVLYLRKNTIQAQLELIESKKYQHFAIISLFKSIGGI
jgi:NodT family efflux transporter outer membrane factor (OMF) lipoprotein